MTDGAKVITGVITSLSIVFVEAIAVFIATKKYKIRKMLRKSSYSLVMNTPIYITLTGIKMERKKKQFKESSF